MHVNQLSNACGNLALMVSSSGIWCTVIPWLQTFSSYCTLILCACQPLCLLCCDPPCLIATLLHMYKTAQMDCVPHRPQPTTHLASMWGHRNLLGHVLLCVRRSLEKIVPNYKPQSHCPPGRMLPFYSWSTNTPSPWHPPTISPTHTPTHPHIHTHSRKRYTPHQVTFYLLHLLEIVLNVWNSIQDVHYYNILQVFATTAANSENTARWQVIALRFRLWLASVNQMGVTFGL